MPNYFFTLHEIRVPIPLGYLLTRTFDRRRVPKEEEFTLVPQVPIFERSSNRPLSDLPLRFKKRAPHWIEPSVHPSGCLWIPEVIGSGENPKPSMQRPYVWLLYETEIRVYGASKGTLWAIIERKARLTRFDRIDRRRDT